MTYTEALNFIRKKLPAGSKPGLERTQKLLSLIGNPEKSLRFVHIAGTNGKGSVASMTASVLVSSGYKTGLFTSPAIFEFNDHIRINGVNIFDTDLAEITEYLVPFVESMEDKPTEFEFTVCLAMEYFKRCGCHTVCLEAGMGGELDATNVILSPVVAVLTNIGLDHTAFLGDTLEKIAETKSGIIKEGTTAVIYGSTPEVEKVIEARCKKVGARLLRACHTEVVPNEYNLDYQCFCWRGLDVKLPLLGDHQIKNVATVLSVIDVLREKDYEITNEMIKDGLENVKWQGRFDVVSHNPLFVIDGGHNPQCIEELVNNVRKYLTARPLIVLTGVLADKDYEAMYREMLTLADEFVTITPPNPRALTAKKLAEYIGDKATPCESIDEAVSLAIKKAGDKGTVLAYGSLYSVGDIIKYEKELLK